MGNINTFKLVFDTRVEKLDEKIRELSQRIKIDDSEITPFIASHLRGMDMMTILSMVVYVLKLDRYLD